MRKLGNPLSLKWEFPMTEKSVISLDNELVPSSSSGSHRYRLAKYAFGNWTCIMTVPPPLSIIANDR